MSATKKKANSQTTEHLTHPASDIKGMKSRKLGGKRIVLGVTGSIAAVESVRLAHELIRHSAEVLPVMSHSAAEIIHPNALEFATGRQTIVEIGGKAEHISLCGSVKGKADLLLISPCTANTLSKIACGIDDTSVTTFATTAIGTNIPIIIVPAMHASMYSHPIVKENIKKLQKLGILVLEPRLEENKAKMADIEEVVENVIRFIGKRDLLGKKTLVIAGATAEEIDDVRIITNRSTGKTGIEIAKNIFERGGGVKLLYGVGAKKPPQYVHTEKFSSVKNLIELLRKINLKTHDIIIVPAAISDYTTNRQKGKIASTKKKVLLKLTQTPKVVNFIRKNAPKAYLVGFKAEWGVSEGELINRAYRRLEDAGMDLIIANDISLIKPDENTILIIDKNKHIKKVTGNKQKLAEEIIDQIIPHLNDK
jgi:phosphopantothenoylcysteine decarboxylase/phosphopantothenate--cysteine ligase